MESNEYSERHKHTASRCSTKDLVRIKPACARNGNHKSVLSRELCAFECYLHKTSINVPLPKGRRSSNTSGNDASNRLRCLKFGIMMNCHYLLKHLGIILHFPRFFGRKFALQCIRHHDAFMSFEVKQHFLVALFADKAGSQR